MALSGGRDPGWPEEAGRLSWDVDSGTGRALGNRTAFHLGSLPSVPLEARTFWRAPVPNCPDLARRQVGFFQPLSGYDPQRMFAEAQGPAVYREFDGPAVFVLGNERHAIDGHRFRRHLAVTVHLLCIRSVVPLIFPPICSVQTRSAAPTAALPPFFPPSTAVRDFAPSTTRGD